MLNKTAPERTIPAWALQPATAANPSRLFRSFFLGGFESSTHRHRDGRHHDLIAATEHDIRAEADYRLLQQHGIRTARDGIRWHLIERAPKRYDFSSFLPMLRAARATGTQVIWDLLHYGWPDDLDIWSSAFIDRFAAFVRAVARLVRSESDDIPFFTPVNEISFWAWGGGDTQYLNPFASGRGGELKAILVRAAITAVDVLREVDPRVRIAYAEPLIHVFPRSGRPEDVRAAADYTEAQFEATDMITGRLRPELGGRPEHLDILGLNFYPKNEWVDGSHPVFLGEPLYIGLHRLLRRAYERYERPIFLSETGTEAGARAAWLHYVGDEVALARAEGVPVEGICLYPILNHLGWYDDRYCENGLFCGVAADGARPVHQPMAEELARQTMKFQRGWHYR